MIIPKFEFKCISGEGSSKTFRLKNVSSVHVSEISAEAFELLTGVGYAQNLFTSDIEMPTSLGPDETGEFSYDNRVFEKRSIGYKELRLVFAVIDEYSNKYRCVASKNVENNNNYMLGEWKATVELIKKEDMKENSKP